MRPDPSPGQPSPSTWSAGFSTGSPDIRGAESSEMVRWQASTAALAEQNKQRADVINGHIRDMYSAQEGMRGDIRALGERMEHLCTRVGQVTKTLEGVDTSQRELMARGVDWKTVGIIVSSIVVPVLAMIAAFAGVTP